MSVDDMMIDTSDYDVFSQLEDHLEVVEKKTEAPVRAKEAEVEVDDEMEDFDLPSEEESEEVEDDEESEDEEAEEDEEEEESEEEESEEEEASEESDEEGSEEEEVDYEGYEVTLPSGETVKLSEAISGYKAAQELQAEREEFENVRREFEEKSKGVTDFLLLAKLEAEKVVEDYKDFDWAKLSKEDPQAYVEHREFLDKYKARLTDIKAAFSSIEAEKAEQEQARLQEQAKECVQVLQKDIPGWNKELYGNLMQFAVDNGMDEDVIKTAVDPAVFKLLHKAYQFEKGKSVAKAKIARVGAPKKVVKSAPKTVVQKPNKKAIIAKKVATGKLSESDMGIFFDALED